MPGTGDGLHSIVSGKDTDAKSSVVLIELKQWSEAKITGKDAVVITWEGGALREKNTPATRPGLTRHYLRILSRIK
jgi:hypothetical protein